MRGRGEDTAEEEKEQVVREMMWGGKLRKKADSQWQRTDTVLTAEEVREKKQTLEKKQGYGSWKWSSWKWRLDLRNVQRHPMVIVQYVTGFSVKIVTNGYTVCVGVRANLAILFLSDFLFCFG